MDDNARPHRNLAVEELLESKDITRMDWPAYSPDLNPIKHLWDALGKRIAARLHHPENTQQLKQMLIEEWVLLPQEMLHQLVLSMRRRIFSYKPIGTRTRGWLLLRLADCVKDDFKVVRVTNWRSVAKRRTEWNRVLEKGLAHPELLCQ
ncbi:transposable element Tcb2 transposase [Trichonephila clavipes]|nr:transposable element Tcb2 transposase [Trichonephila clavipes]